MDKSPAEIDDDFKSFSTVTTSHRKISLAHGIKIDTKAFIQWTKYVISTGRYPTRMEFTIERDD